MDFKEQLEKIAFRICELYPNINREEYFKTISEMKIVENDDITDKRPVTYYRPTNTLKLNIEELNKGIYDAEYYVTVSLLMMLYTYAPELDGVRHGYLAGVASNLVGNFVQETKDDVVPGVDIYENLRDCVADLSAKIGPEATMRLCSAHNVELFFEMYIGIGLGDPREFLNQLNYLFNNMSNITDKQTEGLVQGVKSYTEGFGEPQKTMSI